MNIILVVFTLVATINAIRVPTVWPEENSNTKHLRPIGHGSFRKRISVNNRENFRIHPHRTRLNIHHRPHGINKLPHKVPYFHSKPKKYFKKHKARESPWKPVSPYTHTKHSAAPNLSLKQYPRSYYIPASSEYVTSRSSPLYKNYRDDETQEHKEPDTEKIQEPAQNFDRPPLEESDHEQPADIPTVPVYPGEGQWAKPGKKHKPYISKQKYSKLEEDKNEDQDGYEIFLEGQKLYNKKHEKFDETRNRKYPVTEKYEEDSEHQKEESESEEEFTPSTMYVQVRRSENEEHLPSDSEDAEDGRLKEVIKDSKILTVYTEEGYEDSAYDHAGHEKEAEDSQGYKEYNKKEEQEKQPKTTSRKHTEDQSEDESSNIYKTVKNPEKSKRKKFVPIKKNKLYKTESTKTKKLKEEPDGTQMEITSEVKSITNPSNDKTEKIVQILPIVYKHSNISNNIPNNEMNSTLLNEEDSITASSNTQKMRKKRFANDFPTIDVKTDFINGILEGKHQNFDEPEEEIKYPYYNSQNINPNSPLKYSENLRNIPAKAEGNMAFYEQANRIQCPEVEDDLAAIPERIQNVEKSVNRGEKLEDSEEAGQSPRLGKLGQRIDCFKRKYFGENPLDSPFFQEKEVEPVAPLFKVLQERSAGFQANHVKNNEPGRVNLKKRKYHSKFSSRVKALPTVTNQETNSPNDIEELASEEIVNDVRTHDDSQRVRTNNLGHSYDDSKYSPEVEVINVDTFKSINGFITEPPAVSLITTPKYSVNITPKNIYDQIKLLDFLPGHSTPETVSITGSPRKGKTVEDATEASQLRMRPNYQNFTPRRSQRVKKKRPQFDVSSFVQDTSRRVTITPNSYRPENNLVYSEQTPLDQMNVFADVINNIRNGSNDPLRVDDSYTTANQIQNNVIRMRVPPKKIHIKVPETVKYSNDRKSFYRSTTTPTTTVAPSTKKSRRGSIRYAVTTEKDLIYDDYSDIEEEPAQQKKHIFVKASTTVYPENVVEEEEEVDSEVSGTHTTETIFKAPARKFVDIVGLVPPSKYHYRTIYQPVEELLSEPIVSESEVVNNYHVLGMKPPSNKQKVYDYSEFHRIFNAKPAKNHKYHNLRRGKRSPNRKSYFEVVRGQNTEDDRSKTQEDDDDYVPHRPKNWHWDEKLKKIVYDKPKEQENSEADDEEVDVVEVEVEDSTHRNIQQTTTKRSFTSTTPLNGPSYVDFVQLLKSKKNYVSIPDPTTTKDGIKSETTTPSTTTVRTDPTKPPEFLSFVSKLRKSDSYKLIEDKNMTKTTTTTTEIPEEDEEEIEDSDTALSNVQNAPGRGAVDIGHNFKIFDVNDFLPKVKTYSPRTEIDYSKYKTIQRPRTQTTTEAQEERMKAEEDERPNLSIRVEDLQEPPRSSTEGKLEIFELSRPTTTTTEASTTITTSVTTTKVRRRRPTTTQRSTVVSSTVSSEDSGVFAHHKPKRVYPRRRPTHIRTRSTTTSSPKTQEDVVPEESETVVIRRQKPMERGPKIISLEEIIQTKSNQSEGTDVKSSTKLPEITVDDVLKNINRLKEVSVEETVSDYTMGAQSDEDVKDDYFDDDNMKIALDNGGTTNRKLVISKDKQQGMFYYTSVR